MQTMERKTNGETGKSALSGRQRLIEAALRLGARKRSLLAVGLRELGREAGLNPNTFYRHFRDADELYLAIIDELGADLRQNVRDIRRSVTPVREGARRTVEYVFDYAQRNPDALVVAIREMHGASPVLRLALRKLIDGFAAEIVEDLRVLDFLPGLKPETLTQISRIIVQQVFLFTLDFIENPTLRAQLLDQASFLFDALFAGAISLEEGLVKSSARS